MQGSTVVAGTSVLTKAEVAACSVLCNVDRPWVVCIVEGLVEVSSVVGTSEVNTVLSISVLAMGVLRSGVVASTDVPGGLDMSVVCMAVVTASVLGAIVVSLDNSQFSPSKPENY